jgi:MFS transporter, APGE family, 1-arseno-3-phosphoglycerate exporter
LQQYLIITASYWAFTLTDGALRMLVVLYFHQLGYRPLDIAFLFLFYEFFGVVTNLFGGWLAARLGLAMTLIAGLLLQVGALSMLLVDETLLGVAWVMFAQALSGIAKDLNKLSAKSGVKLVAGDAEHRLYKWVALLTGSKNALKGIVFFFGGLLLATVDFRGAITTLILFLAAVAVFAVLLLDRDLGKTTYRPKFNDLISKSAKVNRLSAARFFLFGSRDVWFVVALPVFLQTTLGWSSVAVGTLLASWVIGYGVVQGLTPVVTGLSGGRVPDGRTLLRWTLLLAGVPIAIAVGMGSISQGQWVLIAGLLLFGFVFAVNSAVHSYLIVSYAELDGVTLDVGFYYMSNAGGRLVGTLLSGWIFQVYGFAACLLVSGGLVLLAAIVSIGLPQARHLKN